jgi:hypothetical protein
MWYGKARIRGERGVFGRRLIILIVAACASAIPALADTPPARPGALASAHAISPGSWNLVFDDGTSRRICLQDIEPLIQLAHAGPTCGRLVITDQRNTTTVHYSCPGNGWGRTSLLVETPRLVRVNSQGIFGRAPFAFVAEARRVGECDPPPARAPR